MNSKNYFEQVAGQWDQMREEFFPESVRQTACEKAGVQAGQNAADIGAGTGFISEILLQNGLQVVAVDQSEAMLEAMRQKFGCCAPVDYRIGDADHLPLEDGEVDYAFANMYLHHTEDPAGAIAEMSRIIKAGGKVIITDLDEHNFDFLRTEQHDRWMGFKRDDVRNWFTEAGLKDVSVDCVGSDCCAGSECGCQQASVSIFIAYGTK